MKRLLLALALLPAQAGAFEYRNAQPMPAPPSIEEMRSCIGKAAETHAVGETLLYLILRVEDGRLGKISRNASGAPPDVGPAQVNGQWIGRIAARWRVNPDEAFLRLRDDFCWNLDAAAWIARLAFDGCGQRDFWRCFAGYHSRTPQFQDRYLRLTAQRAKAMLRNREETD